MNGVSGFAVLMILAAMVGVPVVATIGVVFALLGRTEQLMRSARPRLAALPCPRCDVAIGADGAAAAAAAHGEMVRKLRELEGAAPIRLRIDPYWQLACPACGTALRFDPGSARACLTDVFLQ
jgi:hypothetical protein